MNLKNLKEIGVTVEERLSARKTIREPAREVNVCREADVVVVGGGPAGVSAAIAAAREGANTLLVERYGHLGGMATGGLVLMIIQPPPGICQEWIDRLDVVGGAHHPKKEDLGSRDEKLLSYWRRYFRGPTGPPARIQGPLRQSAMVDPELLKCVLNDMVDEAGVKLLLHSWGSRAIVDKNRVQGIVFESKSGRQAVLGKVIIDATGDGDIFASAGAGFDGAIGRELRSSQLALVFRLAKVDWDKFADFRDSQPQKWQKMRGEVDKVAGFHLGPQASSRDDVTWVNNWILGLDPLKVEDLTRVEIDVRKAMIPVYNFFKKKVPGFESSFIFDSASQIGTRGSRRLIGEYVLTRKDVDSGITHDDTIAVFPRNAPPGGATEEVPQNVGFPYRSLVPVSMDGLLVAGRCFSSDPVANTMFNVIPHCVAMGQAAGTAAALAVKNKVEPRKVNYRMLQKRLVAQGVSLPTPRSTS